MSFDEKAFREQQERLMTENSALKDEVERLKFQVEKEHDVAGDLKDGLVSQYKELCEALDKLDFAKPVVDAAIAYEVDQESYDKLSAAIETYKSEMAKYQAAYRIQSDTNLAASVVGRAERGKKTLVREILLEIINMIPLDTVNVVNASARLVLATQEACARVAEGVKNGYTANIRSSLKEQELVKDKDGPWVLNADVAKAIRESKL